MNKEELLRKLVSKTNECGVIHAIYECFGHGVKVEIGFSSMACSMSIDEINFSVRSLNALKRAGMFTIGDVIHALSGEDLLKVRNLGRKSLNEIKTKILAFGFERLSDPGKHEFFSQLVDLNM